MTSDTTSSGAGAPARPAFRRRGHIAATLLVALFLVGVVPTAFLAWKMIRTNREALSTAEQKYQLLLASSLAQEVDAHVEGLRDQLTRVAQTMGAAVRRRGTIPRAEIRGALSEVTGDRLTYLRYTYFEQGRVRSVSTGDHPEYLEPLFQSGLQQAAAAEADGRAGEISSMLSDPFLVEGESGAAALVVASPVVSGGSFRGVLTGLVDLTRVWQTVVRRVRTGHVVFAMDEAGNVFASTDRTEVRPGGNVSESELVARFLSSEGRAREALPFTIFRHGEEQRFIGAFEETKQGWGIFVQARDSDVYWSVGNVERRNLTFTAALLLLATLAALLLARSLSTPVNRLAAAARALAKGDLSVRVRVRSRNEIGELAHGFNSMAAEIQGYIERLKVALRENNELFLGTIRALAQAIDAKDPYTRGHSVRVNRYSVIIAQELGLPEAELREVHVSSLLHDVGKIGIDDAILRKTSALTDAEFETIKTHPVLGANIMAPIRQMENMLPGLRYHHERANGRGYPDGLIGEEIPLMAKIIAVADTFDAITTNRPYQTSMTYEQAVARVNELKGEALDPSVVEAFNRACHAGLIRLDEDTQTNALAVPEPPAADRDVAEKTEVKAEAP